MKSINKISQNDIEEKWFVIDAAGQRIGRVASIASELLLGKNDPLVSSNLMPRAHVVVLNSDKLDIAPKRGFSKFYKWFSGYPSGLRHKSLDQVNESNTAYPIEHAIKGMLPKNKRGRAIYSNLKVYTGSENPHEAQKPTVIDIKTYKL